MGMRTFTEVAKDQLLAVVPGSKVVEFSAALSTMKKTNDAMASFYQSRKESLARNS
jgi:hypothetical protein